MKITNFKFIKTEKLETHRTSYGEPIFSSYNRFYGYATFILRKYPWSQPIETIAVLKGLPSYEQISTTPSITWAGGWYSSKELELYSFNFRKKLDSCLVKFNEDERQRTIVSELIDYISVTKG